MILLTALALGASSPRTDLAQEARAFEHALRGAERDLCGKQVALLGENGFHGDGKTVGFKTALVQRLVRRCGFRAVYFEASHYDFLAIQRAVRRREPVTEAMVSSAIGGIWNRDRELAPLVPFLTRSAVAGRLTLGGLDDQLGGVGEFYSLETMPAELAAFLPPGRREPCRTALRQRMQWRYSQTSPHDETSVARVAACAAEMRIALRASGVDSASRSEYVSMLDNIERALARDFLGNGTAQVAGRDRSMYLNFRSLAAHLKPRTKIVVWSENSHVAKDAALDPAFPPRANLGAFLHRDYGRRAFALGFSATAGAFRWSRGQSKPIPAAPVGSLEAALIGAGDEAVYAGPAALTALGSRPGSLYDHRSSVTARWADLFDGIVVFREERPPKRLDES
jgi:erythromycin esterase-like protein